MSVFIPDCTSVVEALTFVPLPTLVSHRVIYLIIRQSAAMSASSCIWGPPTGAQIRLFTLELIADTASYGKLVGPKPI